MQKALSPYSRVSNPHRYAGTRRLFDDCLSGISLTDKRVLELGPGTCCFLDLAKAHGANTFGVDKDPAVVELGELRGHAMLAHDYYKSWPPIDANFDGIFIRGSINCFNLTIPALERLLNSIILHTNSGGWLIFIPFNTIKDQHMNDVKMYFIKKWIFNNNICVKRLLADEQQRYYLNYQIPEIELWTKNL